ncbi:MULTISPECIES: RNA-guided endonuclease TnpB family protein [Thermococcus]|uniref:IS element ISTsi3 orfB, probably transposase n=2 Tax=Thermococcus sibiricus TaxID=172049 RepID=C5ZZU9_THESM|nr:MULTISPECIES: RNA-guided endonuclease TnpB family protein [Thermococcus]KUK29149.1 MAG: IS element ISTsi3 orfB, probably transposase [Thermococcus sp. 40_45]HII66968.1 transposase [Thermococcaceae archaeon]ACS90930.1 IS element ISTsi3 orfB, probably transposase [Thermococcus sibiricus MM 739]KUK18508.1 MAG: IS element ISTsi3 orfB, probably transposase [Thermococcus sibiricus]MBC7094052.1 transposase [Thermococcus sp.]
MKRSVTVKLQPSKEQEKTLFELAQATAIIWNKLNYERLKQFKEFGKIDFATTEKEAYHTFKDWVGGSTVQQLARKNAEAWRSFFTLIKKKKKGELPSWLKPRPPKFVREKRGRKLFVIPLRNDQYRVEGNVIELRRLGKFGRVKIQFKGRIHLKGKQGRLEIVYDDVKRKWYAHISYTVEEKLEGNSWVKLPREPKGNLTAGIDLGVNNLMAVYVENGESFLVNGRPLKSIAFYWQERISEYQSKLNKSGAKASRKLKRMHEKAKLQARHYINTAVRQTVRRLYDLGVSRIVVGYPKKIAREPEKGKKQNFLLSHVWRFNYVIKRLKEVAEEYGIQVLLVDEDFTSQTCPLCGQRHSNGRIFRGLFKCRREGVVMNADLVGAFNILKKAVKTITPSLSGLTAGRGNGGKTLPEGLKTHFILGLNETPQTSPP